MKKRGTYLQFGLDAALAVSDWHCKGGAWITIARRVAGLLAEANGRVTSDIVIAVVGLPEGIHHNVIGTMFSMGFTRAGSTPTRRPVGRYRRIGVWELNDHDRNGRKE